MAVRLRPSGQRHHVATAPVRWPNRRGVLSRLRRYVRAAQRERPRRREVWLGVPIEMWRFTPLSRHRRSRRSSCAPAPWCRSSPRLGDGARARVRYLAPWRRSARSSDSTQLDLQGFPAFHRRVNSRSSTSGWPMTEAVLVRAATREKPTVVRKRLCAFAASASGSEPALVP